MPVNVRALAGLESMARSIQAGLTQSTGLTAAVWNRMFRQWAAIYRAWARDRFDRFSKGGGDWPPLSPATMRRRRPGRIGKQFKRLRGQAERARAALRIARHRAAKSPTPARLRAVRNAEARYVALGAQAEQRKAEWFRSMAILVDTGILKSGLSPTLNPAGGAIEQLIRNGITVGYGGTVLHEKAARGGRPMTIAAIAAIHNEGLGRCPRRAIIVAPPASSDCVRQMQTVAARAIAEAVEIAARSAAG